MRLKSDLVFVENIKTAPDITGRHKSVMQDNGAYTLKEPAVPYTTHLAGKKSILSTGNTILLE